MCRWVEGVVIVGAGADAGATKSVLGDTGAAGDSERGSMADGRARVPEVLAPAELEGFLAGARPYHPPFVFFLTVLRKSCSL